MDEIEKLKQKISELEFANDQLASELIYLDGLMRAIGFTDGLATEKQLHESSTNRYKRAMSMKKMSLRIGSQKSDSNSRELFQVLAFFQHRGSRVGLGTTHSYSTVEKKRGPGNN